VLQRFTTLPTLKSKAWREKHTDFMQRFYATVEKVYARFFMAKPYLLYKTSNNIYYAEILLPDG